MHSKKEVVKHSGAIQVSNDRISLLQRKIWNVLLANAYDDLLNKEIYSIKLKDLASILRFDSKNFEFLKEAVAEMQTILIQWNILDKDRAAWVSSQFLGEVAIKPHSGVIDYSWGPEMRKKLHSPTMYAKISLAIQSRFKSKYSLILYELCLDYFMKKQGKGETPWIDIEDFKKLLGVENDKYCQKFYHMNHAVIKKALTEINKESDIFVQMDKKRECRKIIALKFHISPSPNTRNILTRLTEVPKQEALPFESEEKRKQELYDRMTKYFCLRDKQAKEILNSMFDLDQIEDILAMLERKIRRDEIMNVGAYAYKALKEDYRPKRSFFEIEKEQEAQTRKKQHTNQVKEQEILERLLHEYQDVKRDALGRIPPERMADVLKNFEQSLNDFTKRIYRENGLNSPAVKESLLSFVAESLGDQLPTFPDFARERGYFVEQTPAGAWQMFDIKKLLAAQAI
jgi:plasmid replication initiation protein